MSRTDADHIQCAELRPDGAEVGHGADAVLETLERCAVHPRRAARLPSRMLMACALTR